jgi:phytoene synthase
VNAKQILARGSKSFALAAKLLPRRVGEDAAVVYAFCRRADDAIDVGSDKEGALQALRAEVDAIYSGTLDSELADVVRRRRIPRAYLDELIGGMEMDVRGASYASLGELLVYCHRVAGTVGLMMCHVMGVRDARALRHAAHLGIAMQLTNICRDVAEDCRNGRLYLPRDLLGGRCQGVASGPVTAKMRLEAAAAVQALLAQAERYYRSADEGIHMLGWRCALAVRTARYVYAEIGRRIEAQDHDVLAGRAVVPLRRKLVLVLKALVQGAHRNPIAPAIPASVLRFPDDVLPL